MLFNLYYMENMKLVIKIPNQDAEAKVVIDILSSYGYDIKDAKLAVQNIKDKNNVDKAVEWLIKKNISTKKIV